MPPTGFVVRPEYLLFAQEKAAPAQRAPLRDLQERAAAVDTLERTLPDRLREARRAADLPVLDLSRSARQAVGMAADADHEVHRLLARRCRRATTAADVLRELVAVARDDLAGTDLDLTGEDEPTRQLVGELVASKRSFLADLEDLLRRYERAARAPAS